MQTPFDDINLEFDLEDDKPGQPGFLDELAQAMGPEGYFGFAKQAQIEKRKEQEQTSEFMKSVMDGSALQQVYGDIEVLNTGIAAKIDELGQMQMPEKGGVDMWDSIGALALQFIDPDNADQYANVPFENRDKQYAEDMAKFGESEKLRRQIVGEALDEKRYQRGSLIDLARDIEQRRFAVGMGQEQREYAEGQKAEGREYEAGIDAREHGQDIELIKERDIPRQVNEAWKAWHAAKDPASAVSAAHRIETLTGEKLDPTIIDQKQAWLQEKQDAEIAQKEARTAESLARVNKIVEETKWIAPDMKSRIKQRADAAATARANYDLAVRRQDHAEAKTLLDTAEKAQKAYDDSLEFAKKTLAAKRNQKQKDLDAAQKNEDRLREMYNKAATEGEGIPDSLRRDINAAAAKRARLQGDVAAIDGEIDGIGSAQPGRSVGFANGKTREDAVKEAARLRGLYGWDDARIAEELRKKGYTR